MQALLGPAVVGRQTPLVQVMYDLMPKEKQYFKLSYFSSKSQNIPYYLWLTIVCEDIASCETWIICWEVTSLTSWNWGRWGNHWWVRDVARGHSTLCCITEVANTALIVALVDLDEAIAAPSSAPGVLDQPVVLSRHSISAIANNKDSMVNGLASAAIKDSIGVVAESQNHWHRCKTLQLHR